jgi:hypothetical protein
VAGDLLGSANAVEAEICRRVAADLPAGADSPEVEVYTESAEVEAEDARAVKVPVRASVPVPVFASRELMKDLIPEGPSETEMPARLTDRSGENCRIKTRRVVFSLPLRKFLKKPIPIMMAH